MEKPKIIVFAGLPLTGKTTLSKLLQDKLKICRIDIDEVRHLLFRHQPVDSEKDREQDQLQMRASWKSLFVLAENIVRMKQSVIVAGTFSRSIYHYALLQLVGDYDLLVKAVYCSASPGTIAERIAQRQQDKENPSNLKTMEGYWRVKERYQKISLPDILEIDTSLPIEECLARIIDFAE